MEREDDVRPARERRGSRDPSSSRRASGVTGRWSGAAAWRDRVVARLPAWCRARTPASRRAVVLSTALLLGGASVAATWAASRIGRDQARLRFSAAVADQMSVLSERLRAPVEALHAMRAMLASHPAAVPSDLAAFAAASGVLARSPELERLWLFAPPPAGGGPRLRPLAVSVPALARGAESCALSVVLPDASGEGSRTDTTAVTVLAGRPCGGGDGEPDDAVTFALAVPPPPGQAAAESAGALAVSASLSSLLEVGLPPEIGVALRLDAPGRAGGPEVAPLHASRIFVEEHARGVEPVLSEQRHLSVGGATWVVDYVAPVAYLTWAERWLAALVGVGCALASAALVLVVATLQSSLDVTRALASDLQERSDHLTWRAGHDPLTGLANRAAIVEILQQAVERREGEASALAVALADLDGFKHVNDILGHATGDALLVHAARRLERALPDARVIGRLGGDEFTVVVEGLAGEDDAQDVARRVREALTGTFEAAGRSVPMAGSVGVAVGRDGASAEALMRQADHAMYEAKRGSGTCLYDSAVDDRLVRKGRLEALVTQAVADGTLGSAFQPLVRLSDGHVVEFEAFARLIDEAGRSVPTDVFLPVVESLELCHPFFELMLQQALASVPLLEEALGATTRVWINVSPCQLAGPAVLASVDRFLRATGIPGASLGIEIVERLDLDDTAPVVSSLRALRRLGVQVAVDDFGSTHGSIQTLRRLPIDRLKVGRELVGMLGQGGDESFVRTVIGLARARKLTTVGQGVETAGQAEALSRLGCDLAQGHFHAPPLDLAGCLERLRGGLGAPVTEPLRIGPDGRLLSPDRPHGTRRAASSPPEG